MLHTDVMAVRRLPDLTPGQVIRLQDALLANANTLLTSALALLDVGHAALARSLAILGLEESGKAVAIHERRVAMGYIPDGELFRCDWLDELWASHEKKLQIVHRFLVAEPYWFDVQPPDPGENARHLGTISSWSRRNDRSKQRGFYVSLGRTGNVIAPGDVADDVALHEVIARVHQIGWQLRLGEHIEGKRQDEKEAGVPPANEDDLVWLAPVELTDASDDVQRLHAEIMQSMRDGVPGVPLRNTAYRFNPPGADMSPFRNVGRTGHEAETRELMLLARG